MSKNKDRHLKKIRRAKRIKKAHNINSNRKNTSSATTAAELDPHIKKLISEHQAKESLRKSQQGHGKPIIATDFQGYKVVAVGNKIHYSKNYKTFYDFLGGYIGSVLVSDWGNAELKKPFESRHTIIQWYDYLCKYQKEHIQAPGEIHSSPIIGLTQAYYGLSYNLYLLQHNSELQQRLINRLKIQDQFHGAYYETYVAALFLLAGYKLELENEDDPTITHVEFSATKDGKTYSVEAKTRTPNKDHLNVGNQLYKALKKQSRHERIIFIDLNVGYQIDEAGIRAEIIPSVKGKQESLTINNNPAEPAYVFVTNAPSHLNLHESNIQNAIIPIGFKINDFGSGSEFSSLIDAYKAKQKYSGINDIADACINYKIPVTFDGDIPEFSFGDAKRRFIIGETYQLNDKTTGTLTSGIVVTSLAEATLVFVTNNNESVIMKAPLSDEEVKAYIQHPETFFGQIINVSKNIEEPLDAFEFFYNGYKETPREKLLEFMKNAPNIEELTSLSDYDLRLKYAEGLAWHMLSQRKK